MAYLDALFAMLTPGDPDSWAGLMMSTLAGAAAALAVAILLNLYFSARYRSVYDVVRHGVATLAVLGLLAFAAYDMRHTALGYLGINPTRPAVEFEIRLPDAVAAKINAEATQIELHTDRNQALAAISEGPTFTSKGESILKGTVPLKFRTTQRVMIVNVPGQAPLIFKLRLAASPSHQAEFSPWHLVDQMIASASAGKTARTNDGYAIRYRVI
ncbi:acriflavin resistance protein [Tardiphaga sp. 768_D3_N2_1]|uniref:acriflavin resistance protein n=1 Tax=Tardiphaga sp. 768_D3_N2_1 TaxID=3240783 RepID=UPI003F894A34